MAGRKIIKIGFDFDGVIAYNPLRVLRLPISLFKKTFLHKRKLKFYYPKTGLEKKLWEVAHETSFFPAQGFAQLINLLRSGKLEAYIISARYSFLKDPLTHWLSKHQVDGLFAGYYLNMNDEQPHLFKEKMIKKLDLDYFLEDNWDIVNYLGSRFEVLGSRCKTEIHWVYNILDKGREYPHKHPHLHHFLESIKLK